MVFYRFILLGFILCRSKSHQYLVGFALETDNEINNAKSKIVSKNLDLIDGILLAGDGTKLRAQNSKKNNYNQKKIDRHLAYIENKLAEYCKALETADGDNKKELEK